MNMCLLSDSIDNDILRYFQEVSDLLKKLLL